MENRLRLIAFDTEDLKILSAHLQDARIKIGQMTYAPRVQRFGLIAARFNWLPTCKGKAERLWTGLDFERVSKACVHGIDLKATQTELNLLSMTFTPHDAPSGRIELTFSGGAAIRLEVECVEALMQDLGPSFEADALPAHRV
jgi:hypothetical protein